MGKKATLNKVKKTLDLEKELFADMVEDASTNLELLTDISFYIRMILDFQIETFVGLNFLNDIPLETQKQIIKQIKQQIDESFAKGLGRAHLYKKAGNKYEAKKS